MAPPVDISIDPRKMRAGTVTIQTTIDGRQTNALSITKKASASNLQNALAEVS